LGTHQNAKEEDPFLSVSTPKTYNSPALMIIQGNSIVEMSAPVTIFPKTLGSSGGFIEEQEQRKEIIEYTVESGDTLSSIAEKFNISLDTLLWANDLSKNSPAKMGQQLIILPVSGVLHIVKKGETLGEIAEKYKGDLQEIISFNELSDGGLITTGDNLVIPDGVMPPPKPKQTQSKQTDTPLAPLASSYFICPISACKISQGLHFPNAIDFINSEKCGSPVYAAAGGQVLAVKYGYNLGAGNYVKISHPNGVITIYGHLQAISISAGQEVSQGQIIGLVGGKPGTPGAGKSTGCHLHFSVYGARNPFSR